MKIKLVLSTLATMASMSCGEIVIPDVQNNGFYTSSQDEAANELYLSDLEESADEALDTDTEIDESILEDIQDQRIAEMVDMFFSQFDSDESGELSLDEFLTRAKDRASDDDLDNSRLEAILSKLTADFNEAAGEDTLLSKEEMAILLKTAAPRIGKHRHRHFQGQHQERKQKSWEEILTEFDVNGDGQLNEQEFEAMRASKRDRIGPPHGPKMDRGRHKGPPFGPRFDTRGQSETGGSEVSE